MLGNGQFKTLLTRIDAKYCVLTLYSLHRREFSRLYPTPYSLHGR